MKICGIAPPDQEPKAGLRLPRILLVEDNPGDAELIKILLERNCVNPLEVHSATRLGHAKARLQNEPFAAVVLDLGLPDCQGIETLRRIQQDAGGIPIIVLSGLNDFDLSALTVREGAQDFLSKGLLCGELLARSVRFALDRHTILSEATSESWRDDLTGLHNRRGFLSLADPMFKTAAKHCQSTTLVYLDLDGLKSINDGMGRPMGDQAIQETAATLREVFRESDILARLGGDEFAVLASGEFGSAPAILERLAARVAERNAQPGRFYQLSLSAGAVDHDPQEYRPIESLLQEGDRLMYAQKREKNCRSAAKSLSSELAI